MIIISTINFIIGTWFLNTQSNFVFVVQKKRTNLLALDDDNYDDDKDANYDANQTFTNLSAMFPLVHLILTS